MKSIYFLMVSLILCISLTACGGGDGTTGAAGSATSTGQVVDAPVVNLGYKCGANSGSTDGMGHFSYSSDSTCTFSIGNIQIGRSIAIPSDGIVTPYDLAFSSRKDSGNLRAMYIAQFLQSIDSGVTRGVITISPAVIENLSKSTVTKKDNTFWVNEVTQEELVKIVSVAYGSNKSLVSASTAQASLTSSMASQNINTSLGASPLLYKGFNLSGAEYAPNNIPGVYGTDYIYPPGSAGTWVASAELPFYKSIGANIVRLPFLWERLQPGLSAASTGKEPFNGAELSRLQNAVNAIKAQGLTVILDPHNYSRYPSYPSNGSTNIVGQSTGAPSWGAFVNFWSQLANLYRNDPQIIFGLMNEPNTQSSSSWYNMANSAISSIRSTGANNLLLVPGNFWTGGWTWTTAVDSSGQPWTTNSSEMLLISDPINNYAFDIHQYLDSDGSGTANTCAPPVNGATIGIARLSDVTLWAIANNKRLFLGEIGAGNPWVGASDPSNATCATAISDTFNFLNVNADVWLGWTWWTGGPWSQSATYRVEPDYTSASYTTESTTGYLLPWLMPYLQ